MLILKKVQASTQVNKDYTREGISMTKEEQLEMLKEAKKWEKGQESKMKNAREKAIFYPIFHVAIFTIIWLNTIGVKHSTPKAMLLYLLSFLLFNASAIYQQKKYIKEAQELGITKEVSFGNLLLHNLGTAFMQFIIVAPQT